MWRGEKKERRKKNSKKKDRANLPKGKEHEDERYHRSAVRLHWKQGARNGNKRGLDKPVRREEFPRKEKGFGKKTEILVLKNRGHSLRR